MQADLGADERSLHALRLRQQLLERKLQRAAARRRPPASPPDTYPEALLPVVQLCRGVVLEVADRVIARSCFRPTPHEAALCVLPCLCMCSQAMTDYLQHCTSRAAGCSARCSAVCTRHTQCKAQRAPVMGAHVHCFGCMCRERAEWQHHKVGMHAAVAHNVFDAMLQSILRSVAQEAVEEYHEAKQAPQDFACSLIVGAVAGAARCTPLQHTACCQQARRT